MFKRQFPVFIMMATGAMILMGHFINNPTISSFVNDDSTQWFDIIASFAMILGALNLLKIHLQKIIKQKKNWPYSLIVLGGFVVTLLAGFMFKGAYFITLEDVQPTTTQSLIETIQETNPNLTTQSLQIDINASQTSYKLPSYFKTKQSATHYAQTVAPFANTYTIQSIPWGAHTQHKHSFFTWIFDYIFTPLSATMFALLAFFVASASYRAFRIRNFEASLLLGSGVLIMLGRVPIGQLIPWWFTGTVGLLALGTLVAPLIPNTKTLYRSVAGSIILLIVIGLSLGWTTSPPLCLSIPAISNWIFDVPTVAGSRTLMIGIALGTVATSLRIILGMERSFLGGMK